jgi:hypothetical protein
MRPTRLGLATFPTLLVVASLILPGAAATAMDALFEHESVGYSTAIPDNVVTRLRDRLEAGDVTLRYERGTGWLRSLLNELDVDESSQMLVFSKTSLQRNRIAPRTPRALYFNDDVYIGFCRDGDLIEITAADPQLGAVFYTIDQTDRERPDFLRQTDNCTICHASSAHTGGVPGHVVRSVFTDAEGFPILSAGSFRIDQTSPLEQRWGGWYVTGTHGEARHLGNLLVEDKQNPEQYLPENLNVTDLSGRFDASAYLTPHSDLVALMVMEHQTAMHNKLTQANFATKRALWDERVLDEAFGRPSDGPRESTMRRITNAAEPVVEYLLFSGEASLEAPLSGTSGFAEHFAAKGPRDRQGRSLRDLDLQTRLFKYPCSYLIYSEAFEALPSPTKEVVYRRLHEILTGKDTSERFAHLSRDDRVAILEILRETKPGLPEGW